MNEKFNKNAKVEKFTTMLGIAVRLIVIDPLLSQGKFDRCSLRILLSMCIWVYKFNVLVFFSQWMSVIQYMNTKLYFLLYFQ